MSKLRVGVVMGGPSMEHEVSLNSGKTMLKHLDYSRYDVLEIMIDKTGQWWFGDEKAATSLTGALDRLKGIDVVLLAVHGTFGEDGTLQALLENQQIAFTGSTANASLLAMDKDITNTLLRQAGLKIPAWHVFKDTSGETLHQIAEHFGIPFVVKPVRQGSSVGVTIVKDLVDVITALRLALTHDHQAMVQTYVKGREVSCGVLEDPTHPKGLVALPPTELIPTHSEFFDYEAKYTEGGTREITPPDMPSNIIAEIQDSALRAHAKLGCRGYSRTDMIVAETDIFVIETNTLPGMTELSILPQEAAAAGIAYGALLDRLIKLALVARS